MCSLTQFSFRYTYFKEKFVIYWFSVFETGYCQCGVKGWCRNGSNIGKREMKKLKCMIRQSYFIRSNVILYENQLLKSNLRFVMKCSGEYANLPI